MRSARSCSQPGLKPSLTWLSPDSGSSLPLTSLLFTTIFRY